MELNDDLVGLALFVCDLINEASKLKRDITDIVSV